MTHETQGPEKGENHTKGRLQLLDRLGGEALFTKILEKDGQGARCRVNRHDGLGEGVSHQQSSRTVWQAKWNCGVWKRKLVRKKTNAHAWIKDSKISLHLRKRSWEAREGGRERGRGRRDGSKKRERETLTGFYSIFPILLQEMS